MHALACLTLIGIGLAAAFASFARVPLVRTAVAVQAPGAPRALARVVAVLAAAPKTSPPGR